MKNSWMEIVIGKSEGNARIKNRICPETGKKIPDDMPMWRWRGRRNKKPPNKPLDSTAKNAASRLAKGEAPFCTYCGAYHFPDEKTLCERG